MCYITKSNRLQWVKCYSALSSKVLLRRSFSELRLYFGIQVLEPTCGNIYNIYNLDYLKSHVHLERFYSMEISSDMLIPMTPFHTMCHWMQISAGSVGKRTWPGVQCPNGPNSIWPSELHRNNTYAQNERDRIWDVRIIRLLHTEVVWHTSQSLHAIWCFPTRPQRDCVRIGCEMAFERWVWTNEISIFFYVEISALLMYGNGGVAHTQISL